MTKPNRLTTLARSTAALVLLLATPQMAFAVGQSTDLAACPTTATVVAPIDITKTADMSFGNVVPDVSTPGTVALSAAGARTATTATLATAGTTSPGTFTVTGLSGAAYTVTYPASTVLTNGTPAQDMTVDTFVDDSSVITGGSVTLHVGATLHLAAAQPAGAYAGTFNVTVTYN